MIRCRSIRNILVAGFVLAASLSVLRCTAAPPVAHDNLPAQIGDDAFWRMISEFSEPGGYFRSDNFLSNENAFQFVIPELSKRESPGGVYLGVGPEQNFTYLVALQPKLAFIIDIRRQNMLEHLLYKALIELRRTLRGDLELVEADRDGLLVYRRGEATVALNLGLRERRLAPAGELLLATGPDAGPGRLPPGAGVVTRRSG